MRAVHSTLPVAANLSAMRSALSKPFCTKVAALSLPMCLHQLHILTLPPSRSDILSEPLDRFTSLCDSDLQRNLSKEQGTVSKLFEKVKKACAGEIQVRSRLRCCHPADHSVVFARHTSLSPACL